ncbi:flavin-dependent oxidoreductase [Mycobacterium rhizamassiliense]|jgi:alkanesulfonate monooxygenase SsuD/methylene tetrahydromethanopterin reductase-like flavin-dependent oxidoreductase (luciferase family)|uniref:Flavin-dependent oxidoreductase n=1 Tax=Mycobacterium rhizamassiliense TaxID=1841860 RepID=A0A2U3NP55_9MYCO|nr:LLM class flavin-dependent oxidoreductase [Mycobacterium rhizamassiliense]SPM33291.1 flavin-dependent oxidoreductase [Mycobacterium rhizamassiliense]
MRFGLSGTLGGLEAHGADAIVGHARRVERLGFESVWFNEEHFNQPNGSRVRPVLSPIVLAAAVAAATTTLRLGFSVLLVPLHHPLRLAEEIATLDVLSAGRVNFGVSRANGERYRIPFGYDEERDPGLRQCLDQILAYWSGSAIEVGGVSYTMSPITVQQPHPPIYVGAYSRQTLTWAAERGYPIIAHGIQAPASLHRSLATFAERGGDVGAVPVGRFCYVAESDRQAREDVWSVVCQLADRLRRIGLTRKGDLITTEEDLEPERFYRETAIVGGPDTVASRIAELRDRYGLGRINLLSSFFGYLPAQLLDSSLELFAGEVMPRFARQGLEV